MVLTTAYIKQVVTDYFKDKPVVKAYLFGSYANGSATEDSDVDILITIDDTKQKLNHLQFYLMNEQIEEILGKKVDLVEDKSIYDRLKKRIEETKLLMYIK